MNMGGLAKLCKAFGKIESYVEGKKVTWLWDYANDKPRLESEMTKEEKRASDKAKWTSIKNQTK